MAQQNYGQTPFSEGQEPTLVHNPRYVGQSGGTQPEGVDGRGPAQETRYGATTLSTGNGDNQNRIPGSEGMNSGDQQRGLGGHHNHQQTSSPVDAIHNPAAYGFQGQQQTQTQPESGFKYPGMSGGDQAQPGYGGERYSNQQGARGNQLVDSNAAPSQAGYGDSQLGYGEHGTQGSGLNQQALQGARPGQGVPSDTGYGQSQQPGYGDTGIQDRSFLHPHGNQSSQLGNNTSGFAAPTQTQNNSNAWPTPTMPAGAHQGQGGFLGHQQHGYQGDRPGVSQGLGAANLGQDRFDQPYDSNRPGVGHREEGLGLGAPGAGNRRHGDINPAAAATYGSHNPDQRTYDRPTQQQTQLGTGASPQYGTDGAPWQAGGVEGDGTPGGHPSDQAGFGGGVGAPGRGAAGYENSGALGDGYGNRGRAGADAYGPDGIGTGRGTDSELGVETGAQRNTVAVDTVAGPHHAMDNVKGNGRTGLGHHNSTGYDGLNENEQPRRETLGEKVEDKFEGGHRDHTTTDNIHQGAPAATGYDNEDETNANQDVAADGTTDAPPKKGFMTKIMEKLKQ